MSRAHGVERDNLFSKIIHAREDQFYQEVLLVAAVLTISLAAVSQGALCCNMTLPCFWVSKSADLFFWSLFFSGSQWLHYCDCACECGGQAGSQATRKLNASGWLLWNKTTSYFICLFLFMENDVAFFSKLEMGLRLAPNSQSWENKVNIKMFYSVIFRQILCPLIFSTFILRIAAPETPPTGGGSS